MGLDLRRKVEGRPTQLAPDDWQACLPDQVIRVTRERDDERLARPLDYLFPHGIDNCVRFRYIPDSEPGKVPLMAKAAAKTSDESQISLATAKVKRLVVRNFRCIGNSPVSIDLDDIVILVGPNNAGKSTILRAYEVIMLHGSSDGRLKLEDFPGETVDPDNLPEIELQTYVLDDLPAAQWLHIDEETGQQYVRERWRWEEPGKEPKRQGHRANENDWDDRVPWGAPNVAKSRRPMPHRVDAFASPEEQGEKIIELLKEVLLQKARQSSEDKGSVVENLTTQIKALQKEIVDQSQDDIRGIEQSLSAYMGEIFVGFRVSVDTRDDEISEKAFNFFSTKPVLRMGPEDGHMAPLDKQGSGARRTLLWSALKIASDKQPDSPKRPSKKADTAADPAVEAPAPRPHVLLLDEPEICLHPNAVRDACRVLYDLALKGSGWQVMVTTHSPAFVDITRDNTTIVRVERVGGSGVINGTTVFRPARVKLTDDDKEALKLLNHWDPHMAEFFFGSTTIIVEGDTEYSAFREIIESDRNPYRDVHIVRARGKFVIPALVKIMNYFGSKYSVLHDSDSPFLPNGKVNPAWAGNAQILSAVKSAPDADCVRLATCVPNFESAVFGEEASKDKPYNAVMKIKGNAAYRAEVKGMLDYLIFRSDVVPACLDAWKSVEGLKATFEAAVSVA
ncbi:MAG: AAA family ATPase [Rhodopila sp.]|nr:AAA family ATPase [Rhodopila sp.]